jgi:hypothetical protein
MNPNPKLAALALIAAGAFASTADAAEAKTLGRYDGINYRVVDISGDDHLNLRSRPTTVGRILAEIPFDQRGLASTGEVRNGWIELRFWDASGRAIIGWASARYLEADVDGERTTYAVTGLGRREGLAILREEGGRRVGTLAWNATGIESRGECSDLYCPIRFADRSGALRGWVLRENLVTERFDAAQPADEPYAYEEPDAGGTYWDDVRIRREERRARWRSFWRRVWTGDRHAGN